MSEEGMTAEQAAELVLSEFKGDDRPATVEMVARLYSVMFGQHEAIIALFGLVMKQKPDMIFTDEFQAIRKELDRSVKQLTQDLISMHPNPDGGDE